MDGVHSTKIVGMWTIKHDISTPRFYELLINTDIKGDTGMDLKNFYNHIKICLNEVTRLQEYLLPGYHYIKRHSKFAEYFISYRDNPSYYWNV